MAPWLAGSLHTWPLTPVVPAAESSPPATSPCGGSACLQRMRFVCTELQMLYYHGLSLSCLHTAGTQQVHVFLVTSRAMQTSPQALSQPGMEHGTF